MGAFVNDHERLFVMAMEVGLYIRAHLFKSTNAAMELAEKDGAHHKFAEKLISVKQAAADRELQRIQTVGSQKTNRIGHLDLAFTNFISDWKTLSKDIGLKDATKVGSQFKCRPFEEKIKEKLNDVAELEIKASKLSAKSEKYKGFSGRLELLRNEVGNSESSTRSVNTPTTDFVFAKQPTPTYLPSQEVNITDMPAPLKSQILEYIKSIMAEQPDEVETASPPNDPAYTQQSSI
jgi:hypothetical protein